MIKGLLTLAALAVFILARAMIKKTEVHKAGALVLPCLAAAISASWEPLCLIPVLGLEQWLNLPSRMRGQRPKAADDLVALVFPEALTAAGPQVTALCVPFQLEGTQRRRGGDVLFNTAVALCASSTPEGEGLARYAIQQGFEKQRLTAHMPLMNAWEEAGLVFCQHQDRSGNRTFIAGEPQSLLARCKWVLDGRERLMESEEITQILRAEEQMREAGLSVYAFAMAGESGGCTYLGMAGLAAPIRPGTYEQVKHLNRLGARPILLGQGSREKVWALACETGMIQPGDRLVMGEELDRMDDDRLVEEVRAIGAYANLEARHRKRILSAWRQWGENVVPLGPDGLEGWEAALKQGRRLEKAALRLEKDGPIMTFAPAAVTLIGALLDFWPLCVASIFMSAGLWIYQILRTR